MIEKRARLLLATALLAACTTARPPAPVVKRTAPAGQSPAPAPASPARPVQPRDDAGGVQAAPVRPGGSVEVRPLAGVPAPTGPAIQGPISPPGLLKSAPKVVKRPYSEAALAELQAAEAPGGTTPPNVAAAAKPAEPAATSGGDDPKAASDTPKASALEFAWPAKGKVLQAFAEPSNLGLAIDGQPGDPVMAAADGRVIFSGPGPRGYGNLLIVKHDGDTVSVYAHNRTLLVKEGQSVKRGQRIAEIGDTGAEKPGLHFEIRKQGRPVDPIGLLPRR
jgi:lipoprotein NlpD